MARKKKGEETTATPTPDQAEETKTAEVTVTTPDPLASNPEYVRFSIAKKIAYTLSISSLTPEAYRGREADCFVAIQMGHSIGLDPFQSVQSIAVIDGKPCLYGDALIGVARASPLCEWIHEEYDPATKIATCMTQRKGDPKPSVRTFSWEEAKTAGLTSKAIWNKYPQRMIQMRARSWCLRDTYPDVLKGLRVYEEVMDYSDEPAPITRFELPEEQGAKAREKASTVALPAPATGPVTLAQVQEAFRSATDMAGLLKASDLTKRLEDMGDLATARDSYKARRAELIGGDNGQA